MAGPPKDESPSELWARLSERPRPWTEFQFPGVDAAGNAFPKCKLWILTEAEMHSCRANATRVAKAMIGDAKVGIGDIGYEEMYRNEMAVEMVALCVRVFDDPKFPAFPKAERVRQKLTTDEIAVLADAYTQFRVQSCPTLADLTPAEMEAWIVVLMEGASRAPLAALSGQAQSDLLMWCVEKIKSLSTRTSSAGSPPSEPQQGHDETPPTLEDLIGESELPRPE